MSGRHLTCCWNCETRQPRTAFREHRCPLCHARNDPPAIFLFLALAFLGMIVGWLGGAAFGAVAVPASWGVEWTTVAQQGAILGTVVIGGLGVVAAFVLSLGIDTANLDKEVLLRGAEIRRQRAEERQTGQQKGE